MCGREKRARRREWGGWEGRVESQAMEERRKSCGDLPALRFSPEGRFSGSRGRSPVSGAETQQRRGITNTPILRDHNAKRRWSVFTELVLGVRSMGFSPCRPPRSSPPHPTEASGRHKPSGVVMQLLPSWCSVVPGCCCAPDNRSPGIPARPPFTQQSRSAAQVWPSLSPCVG